MKRWLLSLLLLLSVVLANAKMKLDTQIWLTDEFNLNATNASAGVISGGSIFLRRVYFTFQGDIGKDWFGNSLSGRLTFDFAKATPVKYAFFDYKIMDALVLSVGLMPCQFGNLQPWPSYMGGLSDLTFTDVIPSPSGDFGVQLTGKLLPIDGFTKNLITYYLQGFNGEGYTKIFTATSTNADNYAVQGTLIISPLDGIRIGGTYRWANLDSVTSARHNAMAIYLAAADVKIPGLADPLPIDFVAEWISDSRTIPYYSTNPAATSNAQAWSVSLGYGLFNKAITPYVRYDQVTPNTDTNNSTNVTSAIYAGLYIRADKDGNIGFKPLFSYWFTKNGRPSSDYNIRFEFEYKTSLTVE